MKNLYCTIILSILSSSVLIGCDCIMSPLSEHLDEVKLILRVKIVEILDTKSEKENHSFHNNGQNDVGYRAKLKVVNNLKGSFEEGDFIELNSNFSNCEIKYNLNDEYILFLKEDENEIFLETCSYSQRIMATKKDRKFYNKIIRKLKMQNR